MALCIGGCADGERVSSNQPTIRMTNRKPMPPLRSYKSEASIKDWVEFSTYRLEHLSTSKKDFEMYVDYSLSIEDALEMLLDNYGIADPTKYYVRELR